MIRRLFLASVPVGGVFYALTRDEQPFASIFKKQSKTPYKIVIVRHGESEGNHLNIFCGWYDTMLSEKGRQEAINAGKVLKLAGMKFDFAHTSVLSRANLTLDLILKESGHDIPVSRTWRLNERHCGAATGIEKEKALEIFGDKNVKSWAKFNITPPPIKNDHKYFKIIVNYPVYKNFKDDFKSKDDFPTSESVEVALKRFLPYWNDVIKPQLKDGKKIIIVAHGLLLKGIMKHFYNLSDDQFLKIKIPNAVPFIFELDDNFVAIENLKYLDNSANEIQLKI